MRWGAGRKDIMSSLIFQNLISHGNFKVAQACLRSSSTLFFPFSFIILIIHLLLFNVFLFKDFTNDKDIEKNVFVLILIYQAFVLTSYNQYQTQLSRKLK